MAIAFVQQVGGGSANNASSFATTAATFTAGNLLVAIVGWSSSTADISDIPAPAGWTAPLALKGDGAPNGAARAFYMPNNPGGSQSWTFAATVGSASLISWGYTILEFSGVATATPLDLTAVAGATGATSSASMDTTAASGTTAAGDLIIELAQGYRNAASLTYTQSASSVPASGWTVGASYDATTAGVRCHTVASYTIQASGVTAPHGIITASSTCSNVAFLLTFLAAAAATAASPAPPTVQRAPVYDRASSW